MIAHRAFAHTAGSGSGPVKVHPNGSGDLEVDHVQQGLFGSFGNGPDVSKGGHECLAGFGAHARNVVELGMKERLAAPFAVVGQGEAVGLVAHVLHHA